MKSRLRDVGRLMRPALIARLGVRLRLVKPDAFRSGFLGFCLFVLGLLTFVIGLASPAAAAKGPKCDWEQEAAYVQATTRIAEADAEIPEPLPATTTYAPTLTQGCGLKTELVDTLGAGIVRIGLPNGSFANFYPILTTDKPDGQWRCNKVKVRSACVVKSEVSGDATLVTMRVDMTRNASEEVLKVDKNGNVTTPPNGKYFALIPRRRIDRYGRKRDEGAIALQSAGKISCGRGTACRNKKIVAAEKSLLTALRQHRLGSLPVAERREDVRGFLTTFHDLTLGQKALHQAIMLNEISVADGAVPDNKFFYASPFELVDAVLWNSAPSYGAHQIDIGSNDGEDLGPFRTSLARVLASHDPGMLNAIRDRTVSGKTVRPLETWGRVYSIATWGDFYRVSDELIKDLRSSQGRTEYAELYRKFLTTSTGCMAALRSRGGVFAKSSFAQLYVMDVANQKGPTTALNLARYAQSLARSRSTEDIEKAMIQRILDASPGSDHAVDVKRRSDNVTAIARLFPDLGGAPPTACDVAGYRSIEKI